MPPRGTLDHIRKQILRRLKARGLSQAALAEAVGHSGQWLSMVLRGKRGLQIEDLDQIAAVLEVVPSVLLEDPELDPALPKDPRPSGGARGHAKNRPSSHAEARIARLREIIAQKDQTLDAQQRLIDAALSQLHPAVRALERIALVESAHAGDRGAPSSGRADGSSRARSSRTGGG